MTKDTEFLGRWSRLKRGEDADVELAPAPLEEHDTDLDGLSDAEILEKLNLPDPDTIVSGEDVKAFMATAVPNRIRQRALKALWASDPVFANLDGLVDYGDDFTDAAMVPEVLNTVYQVGKGILRDIVEEEPVNEVASQDDDLEPALEEEPQEFQDDDAAPDMITERTDFEEQEMPRYVRPRMQFVRKG